jgi:hypothetical protein
VVGCSFGSRSPKARNGSIEILMATSSTSSMAAAASSTLAFGMPNMASVARIAPSKK